SLSKQWSHILKPRHEMDVNSKNKKIDPEFANENEINKKFMCELQYQIYIKSTNRASLLVSKKQIRRRKSFEDEMNVRPIERRNQYEADISGQAENPVSSLLHLCTFLHHCNSQDGGVTI
ncbi:hypothetical protein HHI36_008452, partial [Cryptolaemus montrouzieri]